MGKLTLLLLALILATLFACKKTYYCVCTVHDSSGATADTITQQTIDDTELHAKEQCSLNSGTVGTITTSCAISE